METLTYTTEASEVLSNYPLSYASAESHINRSRPWCEDIVKHWNVSITGLETFSERAQRYLIYFKLTPAQLKHIYKEFHMEMNAGLALHRNNLSDTSTCSLRMSDTFIDETLIPVGKEKGSCVALDFGGTTLDTAIAAKVQLEGNGKLSYIDVDTNLKSATPDFPKGCLDSNATALTLFNSLAELTKKLHETKAASLSSTKKLNISVSIGFPLKQRGISQASLIHWTKGYETGRKTNDIVEGIDIDALLECAFWRSKIDAKFVCLLNDASAVLIAGCYENPSDLAPCCVGFNIGSGVNGCYIQPDAKTTYGYTGSVINCELGNFDKSLPVNDIDVEVDFGDEATEGVQLFEKMVAVAYLDELCRRLVVKVWQSEAPQLAWVRHSLPWLACVRIIESSEDNELEITNEILLGLWDWETTPEERRAVKKLFRAVFERSAALLAVAIVALANQTGRLQRAMGGVTCALCGDLYTISTYYRKCLKETLTAILSKDMSDCISLINVEYGVIKGAGILGTIVNA